MPTFGRTEYRFGFVVLILYVTEVVAEVLRMRSDCDAGTFSSRLKRSSREEGSSSMYDGGVDAWGVSRSADGGRTAMVCGGKMRR